MDRGFIESTEDVEFTHDIARLMFCPEAAKTISRNRRYQASERTESMIERLTAEFTGLVNDR